MGIVVGASTYDVRKILGYCIFCLPKNVVRGCVIKTVIHATFDRVFWTAEYMYRVCAIPPLVEAWVA